jgi:hypothetical protein
MIPHEVMIGVLEDREAEKTVMKVGTTIADETVVGEMEDGQRRKE